LKRQLKSLPKTLDATYDRILLDIDDEDRDDAKKVLQWLAFSCRPLALEEVTEVLVVNLDDGSLEEDERLRDPYDILTICSSLVKISSTTDDKMTSEIQGKG
jgi:hypothetical protein